MDDASYLSLMGFEEVPLKMARSIECPCNGSMSLVRSLLYCWSSGERRLMYFCTQCGTKHGAHPDGRPLGIPTNDPVLKELRRECHRLLDELSGTTQAKYNRIAQMMGIKELHFGSLDIPGCHRARECLNRAIHRDRYNTVRSEAKRTV